MKKSNQIISIHLGVVLLYTVVFAVVVNADSSAGDAHNNPYRWIGFMLLQAIMMTGHGVSIIILAAIQPKDKPDYAKGHWLSLLFMLLLGGSLCFILPGAFTMQSH